MIKTHYKLLTIMFAVVFIIVACSTKLESVRLNANIEIGNTIVLAVNDYITKYDMPPSTLNDLVPNFVSEIPATTERKTFEYNPKDKFSYDDWSLTFNLESKAGCTYLPKFESWDCWPSTAGQH